VFLCPPPLSPLRRDFGSCNSVYSPTDFSSAFDPDSSIPGSGPDYTDALLVPAVSDTSSQRFLREPPHPNTPTKLFLGDFLRPSPLSPDFFFLLNPTRNLPALHLPATIRQKLVFLTAVVSTCPPPAQSAPDEVLFVVHSNHVVLPLKSLSSHLSLWDCVLLPWTMFSFIAPLFFPGTRRYSSQ